MNLIESTIALLFRPTIDPHKVQREQQRTARLLRDITDPAESVGECLMDKPNNNDHDTTPKATHGLKG